MIKDSEIFVGPPSVLGLGYPLEIPHLDELIEPSFYRAQNNGYHIHGIIVI